MYCEFSLQTVSVINYFSKTTASEDLHFFLPTGTFQIFAVELNLNQF
jgi:hypothetical protein